MSSKNVHLFVSFNIFIFSVFVVMMQYFRNKIKSKFGNGVSCSNQKFHRFENKTQFYNIRNFCISQIKGRRNNVDQVVNYRACFDLWSVSAIDFHDIAALWQVTNKNQVQHGLVQIRLFRYKLQSQNQSVLLFVLRTNVRLCIKVILFI